MPPAKPSANLLETLLSDPVAAAALGGEMIRESLFLQQTLDAADVSGRSWQLRRVIVGGEDEETEDQDLVGLPLRRMLGPGQELDGSADYRLIGSIGRGGTAIVFQAHQRAINREVAVKVLRDHLRRDRAARQRFLAEARTIGALDHPNVIAVHELAADLSGQLFYSMKRIDGTAWSEVLEERSLDEHLAILLRVADAIRYAHSRGIIHRDIKPANVMLGRFGEVLVADWGLALPYPIPEDHPVPWHSIGGTPAYMAPEIAAGALEEIGPHTDVYLLGATLFELLAGFPPHEGETLLECIQHAAQNRVRPTQVQSELMDIAMLAMATDPLERYLSVEEFQRALRDYQQHQESIGLVRRASKHSLEAGQGQSYERYGLAIALLREALELWPENRRAVAMLRQLRIEFAQVAAEQDDLDLALSLLEAANEIDSPLAFEILQRREDRSAQLRREERYSTLFANSPDAVLVSRINDGMILEANDTFLRMFEHRHMDVVGRRVADMNLWDCPERRIDFIRQIREAGRVDNFETILKTRSEKKIPVLISARASALDGEMLVVAHTRDITQRRAAEDQLRQSRGRLREIQQLANLGTFEYHLENNTATWSDETYRILGLVPQTTPPSLEEYLQLVHPEDRPQVEHAITNAISHGAAYQLHVRHRRPDHSYNMTIARGQPILSAAGKVIELYGTLSDITESKQSTAAMNEKLQSMQMLLDLTNRPLVALRADGVLLAATSQVLQLLGGRTASLRTPLKFQPTAGLPLERLLGSTPALGSTPVSGSFFEGRVPVGPLLRLRLAPGEQFFCGEVLADATEHPLTK